MNSDNNSVYQITQEDVNKSKHLMEIFENAYNELDKAMTLDENKQQINEDLEEDNEAYHNEVNEKLRQADTNIDWLNANDFKCAITYYQNMFPGDEGLTEKDYQKIYEALPNNEMQQEFSDMWEGITEEWNVNQQEYDAFKNVIENLDLPSYKQGMFPLSVSCINNENRDSYFIPEYKDINDSSVDIQKDDLYTKMLED